MTQGSFKSGPITHESVDQLTLFIFDPVGKLIIHQREDALALVISP